MIPFPNEKYKIIYADPPYYFKSYSQRGEKRNATQHYNCMEFNDILRLPLFNICDVDCVLFLWVTDPFLEKSFELIKRWNFCFKTVAFTWVKTTQMNKYFKGMGYWVRKNPEMCLLATKGKPKRLSKNVEQLIVSPRRKHSQKPDCVRDRIVELCGDLPRIELFARQKVKGWSYWGNEI